MPLAIRTRRGSLETRTDIYVSPENRKATVIGMVHVADAAFYREVDRIVTALHEQGATVQYESLRPPVPEDRMTSNERELVRRFQSNNTRSFLAAMLGLDLQHQNALRIQPWWVNADISLLEFLRALPDPERFVTRLESARIGLNDPQEQRQLRTTARFLIRHLPLFTIALRPLEWIRRNRRAERRVILDLRNRSAASAILAAGGDVVAMWGANHLPGIGAILHDQGWRRVDTQWNVAVGQAG
ncbi:hypothetical protein ACQPXM_11310 [Kribbella sp. CA-253562]|uniref:hypothetical protein n=1 Tax=Kribbella sp. CA-253562 TaxID=3239942 RepID=UPI003D8DA730